MAFDQNEGQKALDERKKRQEEDGTIIKYYNIAKKKGIYEVRYLIEKNKGLPGKLVKKHFNIPELKYMTCFGTWGMPCKACKVLEPFKGLLKVDDWLAVAFTYEHVLVIDDPDRSLIDLENPQIMQSSGEYPYYWLIEKCGNKRVGDITDPYGGHNVILERKQEGGAFERTIVLAATPIADSPEKVEQILSKMKKLDEIWKEPDEVYIKKMDKAGDLLLAMLKNKLSGAKAEDKAKSEPPKEAYTPPHFDSDAPPMRRGEKEPEKSKEPEKPKEEPKKEPEKVDKATKPNNAPQCYGLISEYDEKSKKCLVCPIDLFCIEAIKQAKRG